jgi:hypothetical protein
MIMMTDTSTHVHIYTQTLTLTYACSNTHTYTLALTHTHTHIHIHTTRTHTHTHTTHTYGPRATVHRIVQQPAHQSCRLGLATTQIRKQVGAKAKGSPADELLDAFRGVGRHCDRRHRSVDGMLWKKSFSDLTCRHPLYALHSVRHPDGCSRFVTASGN